MALGVLLGILLLPISCGNSQRNTGQDIDYITEGSEQTAKQPEGTGPLWPLSPGHSWRTLTSLSSKDSEDSAIRVEGTMRLADGRSGTLVRSYRNGKPFRIEVYQTKPAGNMDLLALGENEKKLLVFTPAIPIMRSPTKEGEGLSWNGTAQTGKKYYTASAYHRISGVETVTTPFETMLAFRLDGVISIFNAGQHVDFPMVMWFVPGKGPAERRLANQGERVVEVITRFAGS